MSVSAPVRRAALLAPMWPELRPLIRPLALERAGPAALARGMRGRVEVVAAVTGIGMAAAARTAERVLDSGGIDHLLVVGIAGGIGPSVGIGDLVVPERVLDVASGHEQRPHPLGAAARGVLASFDGLLVDPLALARLEKRGAVAIDMETAAIAAVCERRGCPWSVLRAISDRADDGSADPEILALAGPDGRGDPRAVARFLLRRPGRLPALLRLASGMRRAARRAAEAAVAALETL